MEFSSVTPSSGGSVTRPWLDAKVRGSGIMYLVFEDIAPQAKLKNSTLRALGAVLGILLGLFGKFPQGN